MSFVDRRNDQGFGILDGTIMPTIKLESDFVVRTDSPSVCVEYIVVMYLVRIF